MGFGLSQINAYIFLFGLWLPYPRHSMGKFSTKSITSRQHPYPELQSKAWNAPWKALWLLDALYIVKEPLFCIATLKHKIFIHHMIHFSGQSLCRLDGRFPARSSWRLSVPRSTTDETVCVPWPNLGKYVVMFWLCGKRIWRSYIYIRSLTVWWTHRLFQYISCKQSTSSAVSYIAILCWGYFSYI